MSTHYCFQVKKVKLLKSFFNIESNVIKDDKSKLFFSRKKKFDSKPLWSYLATTYHVSIKNIIFMSSLDRKSVV